MNGKFIRNVLVLYQAKDGNDFCKWFHTIGGARQFAVDTSKVYPWIACFERIQITGDMHFVFEQGQRK